MDRKINRELFSCRVGKQWIGFSISHVVEVVPPQPRTTMPLAPPAVLGLINLRGKVITELDVRLIAGLSPREDNSPYHVVIIQSESKEDVGLVVDAVGEVAEADYEQYEKTPDSLPSIWRQVSDGILKQDKHVLVIVDVERLLALSLPAKEQIIETAGVSHAT